MIEKLQNIIITFIIILMMTAIIFIRPERAISSENVSGVTGTWYAETEFKGSIGHIVLKIKRDSGDKLSAFLSLLDIDLKDFAIGTVKQDGDNVQAGFLTLTYDSVAQTLSGTLPAAVVPIYQIPVTFRRVDDLPLSEPAMLEVRQSTPVWQLKTSSAVWSGITYSESLVYAGTDDGSIYAIDAGTGKVKDKFETGGAIRARPVIHDRTLVVQSDDGFLYRLNLQGGSLLWRTKLNDHPRPRLNPGEQGFRYDQYASAAAIVNGTIFIGSADSTLYALDLANGDQRWRFRAGDIITSTPAVRNGIVYTGSFDGNIYALDAASGKQLWRHKTGAAVPSSPVVADERVIIGSRSYDLFALQASSGKPVWNRYFWFSWVESSAAIADGTVYIGSSDWQHLSAFDLQTGQRLWTFDTGGSVWSQPVVDGNAVFAGAVGVAKYIVDHQAAFFAIDRQTGKPFWKYDMPQPADIKVWGFASSPAVGDDLVFVGSLAGTIYAFPQYLIESEK